MSHHRFARYAWFTLAVNIGVVLWGAYVRATGSGAGCGSHWPLCNGEVIPQAPNVKTLIEYSHRLSAGFALLLVTGLVIGAFRRFKKGHPARLGAALSMAFMLSEAGIGAGLVLFELVAENASMARALFVATHLGNTFLLLGALVLTAHWAAGAPPISLTRRHPLRGLVLLALLGTVLVGMSGAVAALGDTLYPAASLAEALEQDLNPTSHILIRLRKYHPLIAVGISLLLLHFLGRVRRQKDHLALSKKVRRHADLLNLLIYAQLALGALNIVLLAPVALQLVHLLLADTVWIVLVLTCAGTLAPMVPSSTVPEESYPSTPSGNSSSSKTVA